MRALLFNFFMVFTLALSAQTEVDFLNSLGRGDMNNIEPYLSNTIDLRINDEQEKIDRSSAIKKIRAFLKSKKILKYKILHNGNSADRNSSYRVARIKTKAGTYRVFAYSEKLNGGSKVVEVRIDAM